MQRQREEHAIRKYFEAVERVMAGGDPYEYGNWNQLEPDRRLGPIERAVRLAHTIVVAHLAARSRDARQVLRAAQDVCDPIAITEAKRDLAIIDLFFAIGSRDQE